MEGRREDGQALLLALGGAFALIAAALALVAIAGAVTGKGRAQRAADLAAISAARSMRDDLPRLLAPAVAAQRIAEPGAHGEDRVPGPCPGRGASTWRERTMSTTARLQISFPDAGSFAPVRVKAVVIGSLDLGAATEVGRRRRSLGRGGSSCAGRRRRLDARNGRGGGYSGPLVYRTGGDAARCCCRLRPDGSRRIPRRPEPRRQLGLSLRRRTGGALRRPSRPDLGGAAGPLAASLRDRARPWP